MQAMIQYTNYETSRNRISPYRFRQPSRFKVWPGLKDRENELTNCDRHELESDMDSFDGFDSELSDNEKESDLTSEEEEHLPEKTRDFDLTHEALERHREKVEEGWDESDVSEWSRQCEVNTKRPLSESDCSEGS